MKEYPFLFFIVRHGKNISWPIALTNGALAFWFGEALISIIFGYMLALIVFLGTLFVVRSAVELIRIITEMLLPQ